MKDASKAVLRVSRPFWIASGHLMSERAMLAGPSSSSFSRREVISKLSRILLVLIFRRIGLTYSWRHLLCSGCRFYWRLLQWHLA